MRGERLWHKGGAMDPLALSFTVGEDFIWDQLLLPYDCTATKAHAKMLGRCGYLSKREVVRLCAALDKIAVLAREGKFKITEADEDCHTAIENHLTKKLGAVGKKIHTARSRNDQVLTALRLYYKDALMRTMRGLDACAVATKKFAQGNKRVTLPGYTHTRKAMPSSVGIWGGAYVDALYDVLPLIGAAMQIIDQSPLGSGAGYGVPAKIDKQFTAKLLGFSKVQENPVYVQLSRGLFEGTLLHIFTVITGILNRMASDIILFSEPSLGFFTLPDTMTTGSSIMPHKKNPDVLELVRAYHHKMLAYEHQVKATAANLISGYHRDMQLLKEPIMGGSAIVDSVLTIMTRFVSCMGVDKIACAKGMTPELFATEEAMKLVEEGMPFRDAYRKIAKKTY